MNNLIVTEPIDCSVYGVRQVSYTVGTEEGFDFPGMVTATALNHVTVTEGALGAVASAVRLRQSQVDALGDALALVDGVLAHFKNKNAQSSDSYTIDESHRADFDRTVAALAAYGYNLPHSGYSVKRGDMMRAQSKIQELLETESNNLQQDMQTMKTLMQKRDKLCTTTADAVEKFYGSGAKVIKAFQ